MQFFYAMINARVSEFVSTSLSHKNLQNQHKKIISITKNVFCTIYIFHMFSPAIPRKIKIPRSSKHTSISQRRGATVFQESLPHVILLTAFSLTI